MITKQRTVYYCEFCKAHKMTKNSMELHEKHCTANPDRHCRVCENGWNKDLLKKYEGRFVIKKSPAPGFPNATINSVEWAGEPVTLAQLQEDVEYCPACTLAIIRQCDLNNSPGDFGEFNYQKANKEYWDERSAAYEEDRGYGL